MVEFRSCRRINAGLNVWISGSVAVIKTHIACALGNLACRNEYSVRCYKLSHLLSDLVAAQGDETCPWFLHSPARTYVLIIDDLGLAEITALDAHDLIGMFYDRAPSRSTIVASQLSLEL